MLKHGFPTRGACTLWGCVRSFQGVHETSAPVTENSSFYFSLLVTSNVCSVGGTGSEKFVRVADVKEIVNHCFKEFQLI